MWAVAEKVGALNQGLDDPEFPQITYRRGASGVPTPYLRGTGIRVQTIVTTAKTWETEVSEIADNYDLSNKQVREALAFYNVHQQEIDQAIAYEEAQESACASN